MDFFLPKKSSYTKKFYAFFYTFPRSLGFVVLTQKIIGKKNVILQFLFSLPLDYKSGFDATWKKCFDYIKVCQKYKLG